MTKKLTEPNQYLFRISLKNVRHKLAKVIADTVGKKEVLTPTDLRAIAEALRKKYPLKGVLDDGL